MMKNNEQPRTLTTKDRVAYSLIIK